MTQSLAPRPVAPAAASDRTRRFLRAVAVAACVPYLGLKTAWIAGSRIGIPDGSPLLEHRATMAVANGVTVAMDAAVIVLALMFTRPWGVRTPAWLPVFPAWVATGLLAPIMAGYPVLLVVGALGGTTATHGEGREPFLDPWVFGVVYGAFILQGLALGTLFTGYARQRWGHLWRGRVRDLPPAVSGRAHRRPAGLAAAVALLPLTAHVLWASGGTAGLAEGLADDRTSTFRTMETVYLLFLLAAVAGACLPVLRRASLLPVKVPLALTWVGSAATTCWAGWLVLASLPGVQDAADRPTGWMDLVHAAEMVTGVLVARLGVGLLTARSADRGR
ncbi:MULTISPECIES: hypothetical protein [unclassified Streptomyces]|uniref:hypothetical protein n=1 Tax=unclassified Streptomyces TaxID=2593676 RepID=UPI003D703EEC